MSQKFDMLYDKDVRVLDFWTDQKTVMIYLIKSVAGKKVKFTTGVRLAPIEPERAASIARAKKEANKKLNLKLNKKKVQTSSLIKDELALWRKVKEHEGISDATLIKVNSAIDQIGEYWGSMFPADITRDNLTAWYAWWRVHHPDIEMENAVKYLRNFCQYLASKVEHGRPLLAAIPVIRDPRAKEIKAERQKKKEKIFTHDDLIRIVKTAEDEVDQLVVLIMYTMATRVQETLTLRFGEEILIDQDPPIYRWTLGQNKADLTGEHYLHSALTERLRRLKKTRDKQKTKLLFPQKFDWKKSLKTQQIDWKAWGERAGVDFHWTSHTFRHTCLSNLFNDEKNPQAVICKLYRVSLRVAIDTYIKVTSSGKAQMRDAIRVEL